MEPEDNDFNGSNRELRLTSDWFSEHTDFYVNQDGIVDFDGSVWPARSGRVKDPGRRFIEDI